MEVKGNHPLAEVIACKLFGISTVPRAEAEKMINRAVKAAIEWHENNLPELPANGLEPETEKCPICKGEHDILKCPAAIAYRTPQPTLSEILEGMPRKKEHNPQCLNFKANETWCDCGANDVNAALSAVEKMLREKYGK